jgi:hypothetical protein
MTTSQPASKIVEQGKRDRITKVAQEVMELAQKVYNMYGAIAEDKVPKLEEARKAMRDVVNSMRW